LGLVVLLLLFLFIPYQLEDAWLQILTVCGCYAIGGIGLNLLTGYTGQVSLGHAFFIATGAYVAANIGSKWAPTFGSYVFHPPLLVWLLFAAIIGGLIGAVIAPFALRLTGNYLAIITLALLFFSAWLFNQWKAVTGGATGAPISAPLKIGPFDFTNLGSGLSDKQGLFWLIWGFVVLAAVVGKNLVRSRAGRAMQAVRDRDLAAEVCGVNLFRTKMGAFAWSSAFAAVGGALYYALQGYMGPEAVTGVNGLVLSITYIAIIIVGGLGTIHGSIIGAIVVVGLPQVISKYSTSIWFLNNNSHLSVASFNNILFGLFIIVFLLAEPLGIANLIRRVKNYFLAWPFSY
jgi:branched-chain amino acid transport system permease protein